MRKINQIHGAKPQHWVGDGFYVQSLFSYRSCGVKSDPFLLLDYAAPMTFAPNTGAPRGVGQHPHKGFETVTIAYQGQVAHRDSSGGGGVIKAGDVQWMTAGGGVIHEEFHAPEFAQKGGVLEMVQLWVNLPKKNKLTPAAYQHLASDDIPVLALDNEAGHVRLIAGAYDDGSQTTQGLAKTFSPINLWDVVLKADADVTLRIPATHHVLLLIMQGDVYVNDEQSASMGNLVTFAEGEGETTIRLQAGEQGATVLLMSGEPINEPVVGYGPFVMNTEAQIREAMTDFNNGQFGSID